MSATRILIFAKAPIPGRVKTRLIPMLGLRVYYHGLFADIPWSPRTVATLTLARLQALGWRVWLGGAAARHRRTGRSRPPTGWAAAGDLAPIQMKPLMIDWTLAPVLHGA